MIYINNYRILKKIKHVMKMTNFLKKKKLRDLTIQPEFKNSIPGLYEKKKSESLLTPR